MSVSTPATAIIYFGHVERGRERRRQRVPHSPRLVCPWLSHYNY